jgi:hypothetical protein
MNSIYQIELFAGLGYTQFTDAFREANRLFKSDRTPKFPLAVMALASRGIGLGRRELTGVTQPPAIPHDNDTFELNSELQNHSSSSQQVLFTEFHPLKRFSPLMLKTFLGVLFETFSTRSNSCSC